MATEAKKATRPHPPQMVKCPRCNSSETKFCYYNNYSTAQPRYFCKNCKRYWTDGGTLRNVPVGGGLRKNKRSKAKFNHMPSSSLLTASMNEPNPSFLMSDDGISQSTMAVHAGLANPNPDVNLGLPHAPNYLLFNPRNYEMDMKAGPLSGHLPLYHPELNIRQPVAPSLPLPMLASGLKNDPSYSGAYFAASPWHLREQERGLSESLQPGEHLLRNESSSVGYNLNSFVNGSDWQQVSEGFFGAGGDENYALMQPPKPAQWTDFDAGSTRL